VRHVVYDVVGARHANLHVDEELIMLISDVHLLRTDSLHHHTHGSPDEQELKRKSC
jgi:hypothetical protein